MIPLIADHRTIETRVFRSCFSFVPAIYGMRRRLATPPASFWGDHIENGATKAAPFEDAGMEGSLFFVGQIIAETGGNIDHPDHLLKVVRTGFTVNPTSYSANFMERRPPRPV